MDVALIRWPDEEPRRRILAAKRSPRLLMVTAGAAPPSCDDPLEDWIRVPAAGCDLDARVATLARRVSGGEPAASGGEPRPITGDSPDRGETGIASTPAGQPPVAPPEARGSPVRPPTSVGSPSTAPKLDDDGVLRFGDGWVSLPPIEARMAAAMVERFGAVVHRDTLALLGWPKGAPGRNALDVHVLRLRRRLAPLGLSITTVRSRGYLLAPAAQPASGATAGDPGRRGVTTT